jgi:hypothetical protein
MIRFSPKQSLRGAVQVALLSLAMVGLMGAGDVGTRFNNLGHKMMCLCSCSQILLECNHVGWRYSDRMRGELMAALDRAASNDLILQGFVQKYSTTDCCAHHHRFQPRRLDHPLFGSGAGVGDNSLDRSG